MSTTIERLMDSIRGCRERHPKALSAREWGERWKVSPRTAWDRIRKLRAAGVDVEETRWRPAGQSTLTPVYRIRVLEEPVPAPRSHRRRASGTNRSRS